MTMRPAHLACTFFAAGIMGATPALGIDDQASNSFPVVEHHGECTAASRTVVCGEIPRLLRELAVSLDQKIVVSSQGAGQDVYARAKDLADLIKAAGYRNVVIVGFPSEP